MPEGVTAEMWKQKTCVFIFQQFFIVAVTDNPADCLIQVSLMLCVSVAVHKYKIRVAINGYLARFQP